MESLTPPGHVQRAYENAAATIVQMTEEANDLEIKFGNSSHLVKRKRDQIKIIKDFYTSALAYQDQLSRTIKFLAAINEHLNIMDCARSLGVPFGKAVALLDIPGFEETRIKDIEYLDQVIERLKLVNL